MADLEVRVEDGALWLTLNRPQVFNALSAEMADEVAAVIEGATTRDDVRVIVVTGTGPAFSTGADISGADAHEGFETHVLTALCAGVAPETSEAALIEMREAGVTLG